MLRGWDALEGQKEAEEELGRGGRQRTGQQPTWGTGTLVAPTATWQQPTKADASLATQGAIAWLESHKVEPEEVAVLPAGRPPERPHRPPTTRG